MKFKLQTHFSNRNLFSRSNNEIVTLPFFKFINFYHFSVPEELGISEIFFAILFTRKLIDSRKGVFLSLSKTKEKKKQTTKAGFLSRTQHSLNYLKMTMNFLKLKNQLLSNTDLE